MRDSKGQTVMEYIIITSLVGIFCLFTIKQLGKALQNRIQYLKSQLVNEISLD